MLEAATFNSDLPTELLPRTIFRGTCQSHLDDAIANRRWFFGAAHRFADGGEGMLFKGEWNAILDFFRLHPEESAQDAATAALFKFGDDASKKDLYNTCWSFSEAVARQFALNLNECDSPVVISIPVQSLADGVRQALARWDSAAAQGMRGWIEKFKTGLLDTDPEVGHGRVFSRAQRVLYYPEDPARPLEKFALPLARNAGLPEVSNGFQILQEDELRISISLANSSASALRRQLPQAPDLEPMITHVVQADDCFGIYLNEFNISELTDYKVRSAYYGEPG